MNKLTDERVLELIDFAKVVYLNSGGDDAEDNIQDQIITALTELLELREQTKRHTYFLIELEGRVMTFKSSAQSDLSIAFANDLIGLIEKEYTRYYLPIPEDK